MRQIHPSIHTYIYKNSKLIRDLTRSIILKISGRDKKKLNYNCRTMLIRKSKSFTQKTLQILHIYSKTYMKHIYNS